MRKANQALPKKQKQISKKTPKRSGRRAQRAIDQQQIVSSDSEDLQTGKETKGIAKNFETYESAEQVKARLTSKVLAETQKYENRNGHIKSKNYEQFFLPSEPAGDQQRTEHLKLDYLRNQNKLYECHTPYFSSCEVLPAIQYKGHTKCITGFEITQTKMYSCSKDRSIIAWDRQTMKKEFISWGRLEDKEDHRSDVLCLTLHSNGNVLATAGEDQMIKLWDLRANSLIDTLHGHKNSVNGVKFGINSNNICSVSSDLTVKQWDFAQRGLIETFYEHNGQVLDIDSLNSDDFATSGNDHQAIIWKTAKQTKVVYKGHEYAIDRIRTINHQRFVTVSQDGCLALWSSKKCKPVHRHEAHATGWIGGLDVLKQSNIVVTGAIDQDLKVWGIQGDSKGVELLRELPMQGIVTDVKVHQEWIAATECDEHRLGRWVTHKCRNKIKVFPIRQKKQ